jgi:hypothetical protein
MAPTIISRTLAPITTSYFTGGKPFDLIDLQTVKDVLGVTDPDSDKFLGMTITQVSGAIKRYCDRVFQSQFYQEQFWAYRDPYPWQLPSGFMPLQLKYWPISVQPSVAGIAPPSQPPVLTASSGGALSATTYFVRVSYLSASGETAVSLESFLPVAASNLLNVASPPLDPLGLATGWNVYISKTSSVETLQNSSPLVIGENWTLPTSGLITGAALPQFVLVVQNATSPALSAIPQALAEGIDFIADAETGQLTRLFSDGYARRWPALPITVQYPAGFSATNIPADVQDAAIRLIKSSYYARNRDPKLRSENIAGAYEAQYWFSNGPGAGNFPPDVENLLDMHRMPVIG